MLQHEQGQSPQTTKTPSGTNILLKKIAGSKDKKVTLTSDATYYSESNVELNVIKGNQRCVQNPFKHFSGLRHCDRIETFPVQIILGVRLGLETQPRY